MLRRALMAASASERVRDAVTRTHAARAVADQYVAGESSEDAVAVARTLRIAGSLRSGFPSVGTGPGYPMIATHDPRLVDITRSLGFALPAGSFEYQVLHGVRPDEQRRLAAAGAKVRVYVPYGGDWYRYLVRRLAERPANLALFQRSLGSKS